MGIVTLSDGRRLAYTELGDPGGAPVIHHHGVPGCRLERQGDPSVYYRSGVRMITPDRPGSGLSDPHWQSDLAGWANDVRQLADALEIDRFAVTALSGGGVFALATAAMLPDRVTAAVLTGCPAPITRPRATAGMHGRLVAGLGAAARIPWLLRLGSGAAGAAMRTWTERVIDGSNRDSETDRSWLNTSVVRSAEIKTIREAFRHGAAGYIHDVTLMSRDWGFRLEDVEVPVHLWHGAEDTVIPLHHAKYLASVLPRVRLVVCRGEGHMVMWGHLQAVLATAAASTGKEKAPAV